MSEENNNNIEHSGEIVDGHLHHNHLHDWGMSADPNKAHVNKDGVHISHWFGDKRHFTAWFDPNADYNTNSKSYYDYLGFRIKQLDLQTEKINELLRRNIKVKETNNVRPVKEGDWLKHDDVITLSNYVKISKRALNDIEDLDDGIWSEDFQPKIDELWQALHALENRVSDLEDRVSDLEALHWGEYKKISSDYFDIKYHNGCRESNEGYGDTQAYIIDGANNVSLHLRFNFGNNSMGQVEASGGDIKPWESKQTSFVESINFKGKYAYLNNLKILTYESIESTPWFNPRNARAGFPNKYELFGKNSYCNYGFNLVLASIADGWGSYTSYRDNYPQPLELQGQVINVYITMRKDITAKNA